MRFGREPTIALLHRLAGALDADLRLITGHDLGSVWFEPTQPDLISTAVSGQKQLPSHRDVPAGRGVQYPLWSPAAILKWARLGRRSGNLSLWRATS